MATRQIIFSLEEFYHIYNRGTEKRLIFETQPDYQRFQTLLYLCNSEYPINIRDVYLNYDSPYDFDRGAQLVAIGAYCLMPNHFHILLTPLVDQGVSTFINKLCTSYSMYFNKKYDRTGRLFQGSYRGEHADSDEYLKYLYSYIHLNPIKLRQSDWKEAGISNSSEAFAFLKTYTNSSLLDYLDSFRAERAILQTSFFPEYFLTAATHEQELFSWLQFADET